MPWRLHYEDRSTFSCEDGIPSDAPGWQVQAIAQADDVTGHSVIAERDYYWWDAEVSEWTGGDLVSLLQMLVARGLVKVGSYAARARYDEILRAAHNDPLLPCRSAWRPDERR